MSDLREPNIDRLLAAFELEKLDRVPHFDVIDPENVARILEKERYQCNRSDLIKGSDAVKIARATCMDFVLASLHYWPTADTASGSVNTWQDIEKIHPADTDLARQTVLDFTQACDGSRMGVGIDIAGPFFSTYMMMGPIPIQSFMLALYDDKSLVEKIMDIQVERQIELIEAVSDLPIAFVELADDLCDNNGFMINPALMEELWVPRYRKILEAAQSLGVPVQCHCCGKLEQVLPRFIEWGIKAISPIQPNCNDIYALKNEWGDKICLVGNINIQGILAFGTPDEVRADVREHIRHLSKNGGYVVASSHSIVDAIPYENYMAMVETVIEYGTY